MAKFHEIMNHLNPKMVIAKVEYPHDSARGQYKLNCSIVTSYAEFERVIVNYMDHHMKATMGGSLPPEMLLSKARDFLDGGVGFKNAVFTALSGTDGGMTSVLTQLSESFKREAKQAYFDYVLDSIIDPMSFEDITSVMYELQNRLGAFSPQSFGYIKPEAMFADYRSILWNYFDSLTKYKNLWDYSK